MRNFEELKRALEERRSDLNQQVALSRRRLRSSMPEKGSPRWEFADELIAVEGSDDLDTTLAEMRSQTLKRIEMALRLMDEGRYGVCSECAGDIAEERLRALPFALRCTACEGLRERRFAKTQTASVRLRLELIRSSY